MDDLKPPPPGGFLPPPSPDDSGSTDPADDTSSSGRGKLSLLLLSAIAVIGLVYACTGTDRDDKDERRSATTTTTQKPTRTIAADTTVRIDSSDEGIWESEPVTDNCFWWLYARDPGDPPVPLDHGNAEPGQRARAEISKVDGRLGEFQSHGCGRWHYVGPATSTRTAAPVGPTTTTTTTAPVAPATTATRPAPTDAQVKEAFQSFIDERASSGVMLAQSVTELTVANGVVTVVLDAPPIVMELNPFENLAKLFGVPAAFNDAEGVWLRQTVRRVDVVDVNGKSLGSLTAAELNKMATG